MKNKLQKIKEIIKASKKCVIAFSGGVDSTLLLKVANDILGENCLAITVCGPLNPKSEIEEAINSAEKFGAKHKILNVDISNFDWFKSNPEDRCYICKTKVFKLIKQEAEKFGTEYIFDGQI
jgi:pyridinium-3,5-biscarboxylic acid mononucleotide sulfurtransferase